VNYKNELIKYYHTAKILELTEKYQSYGYNVVHDYIVNGFNFDLFVTKENEKIYIEVKSEAFSKEKSKKIIEMAAYVKSIENARFELIIATPPRKKNIEFENLSQIIFDYLIENIPSDLDSLSTHTRIEDVIDVDIDSVSITEYNIHIGGTASVEVELQYGSSREQEGELYDSFPLEFDLTLDREFNIEEVNNLSVDTSSFYE
jgi:hypothetical protein